MSQSISARYLAQKGAAYQAHRQSTPDNPLFEIDFAYFRDFLNQRHRVLDFGCGDGGLLRHAREVAGRADGLEVNPAARRLAQETGATIYSSLDELPAEAVYDVIYSNHVLEHVRDVCGTLEALRATLKPGGLLLLKLPFDDANCAYQRVWDKEDFAHHLFTWTPRLLANLLRETGFEVRDCRLITAAWHRKLRLPYKLGLGGIFFWMFAVIAQRRQLLAVAVKPA